MAKLVVPLGTFVFVAFLIYVGWWTLAGRIGGQSRRRQNAGDARNRFFSDAIDMIADLKQLMPSVPFLLPIVVVLAVAVVLFAKGFHVSTVADVAKKDGSTVFFHTCRYLSFGGLHDVDSIFPSSTYQEAESASCPFFQEPSR